MKALLSVVFALFLVCAAAPHAKVQAAEADLPAVTNVQQTKYGTSSMEITFTASVNNNVYYSIQVSSRKDSGYEEYTSTQTGSAYVYGLPNAGYTYYVRVVPFLNEWDSAKGEYVRQYGTPSAPVEAVTSPKDKPASLRHTKSTTSSISIKWNKVAGANIYAVAYAPSGTTANAKVLYTSKTSCTIKKLAKNSEYYIEVYPGRKNSSGLVALYNGYANLYSVPVTPAKASKPIVERWWNSLSEISVSTNSIACADGYKYEVYTAYNSKSKKVKTATAKHSTDTVIKYKDFKKYRYYKIRVRAYSLNSTGSKLYGDWSSWTYACPSPNVKLKQSGSKLKTSWSKVSGAKRYVVYVSKRKNQAIKNSLPQQKLPVPSISTARKN